MILTGFSLRNFKSIYNHRFRIGKLNLFLGKNGMGKSSTIQALLCLRQSLEYRDLSIGKGTLNGIEYHLRFNYFVKGSLCTLGQSQNVYTKWSKDIDEKIEIFIETDKGNMNIVIPYLAQKDSLGAYITFDKPEVPFKLNLLQDSFQYLKAHRISPDDLFSSDTSIVESKRQLGETGDYAAQFLLMHGKHRVAEKMRIEKADSEQLLDQVSAYMSLLGNNMKVRVDYQGERVSLNYDVYRAEGTIYDTIKPQNTGFGLTFSLPVITSLLGAKAGQVQIIENPESHLHPRGQSIMGGLLAKAAASDQQLFIETHSDHVINGIRVAVKNGILNPDDVTLHFFGQSTTGALEITEIRIDRNGELSDYPNDFLDEWDNQLLNLI
ncbi:MAG: DUF3696 domain-containing protein [Bacteroidota bacterium]